MSTEKDALAALQTAEGVHMAMLTGKIAKISMLQCAHTHGEAAVTEYQLAHAQSPLTRANARFAAKGGCPGCNSKLIGVHDGGCKEIKNDCD